MYIYTFIYLFIYTYTHIFTHTHNDITSVRSSLWCVCMDVRMYMQTCTGKPNPNNPSNTYHIAPYAGTCV